MVVMASKKQNAGSVRACTPREFEDLLRRTLNKSYVHRPTSLRVVWSRPAPATEVDPFEDDYDDYRK
jgi:hypothetical protein